MVGGFAEVATRTVESGQHRLVDMPEDDQQQALDDDALLLAALAGAEPVPEPYGWLPVVDGWSLSVCRGRVVGMSSPMARQCPDCAAEMPWRLVYPHPELHSHWECPRDGSRWELTMDGSAMVPFGTRHREQVGTQLPELESSPR